MEAIERELWLENNQLNNSNLLFIKTLAKQKKIKVQETIHQGYNALFLTVGFKAYKVVINTDECKLNILGKNMVGNDRNQYHHVKDIDGTDSLFEAIQFIGGLVGKKRGEYICIGKRFYKISGGYG